MKLPILIATLCSIAVLHGQTEQPKDPYTKKASEPKSEESTSPTGNIAIRYEEFSLPLTLAAEISRGKLTDSDIYKMLLSKGRDEDVVQEAFTTINSISGETARVSSGSEYIYPTQYDQPLPQELIEEETDTSPTEEAKQPTDTSITSLIPKYFETRNLGTTLEIQATISESRLKLDLRIMMEHVKLADRLQWGQGNSLSEMPEFEVQKINTAATMFFKKPLLIGTMNRAADSKLYPESTTRVWFAFVTATLPED